MDDAGRPDAGSAGRAGPGTTPLVARSRELDLIEAVAELAHVATGGQSLVASLERIVTLALSAVPGADGAAVTMADQQQPRTTVVSDHVVRRVHDIADTLREAPWVTATAGGATQTSGELDVDIRWPRFGPRVRALGIHSVLAAPLVFGGEVLGTLDLLARGRDVFDAHARTIGETFAVAAAVTVFNARRVEQAELLAEQMQTALTSRAVIDQAIGILMSRQGGTADDAFERLRQLSQHQNTKLQVVAQGLVDDAVSRARARHAGGR